jgi:hypothetical protein
MSQVIPHCWLSTQAFIRPKRQLHISPIISPVCNIRRHNNSTSNRAIACAGSELHMRHTAKQIITFVRSRVQVAQGCFSATRRERQRVQEGAQIKGRSYGACRGLHDGPLPNPVAVPLFSQSVQKCADSDADFRRMRLAAPIFDAQEAGVAALAIVAPIQFLPQRLRRPTCRICRSGLANLT